MTSEPNYPPLWLEADRTFHEAMTAYGQANERIHGGALMALATMVLSRVPDATGAEVEPSDQGDWMSLNAILTRDGLRLDYSTAGEDGILEEVWDEMDSYCANLDDRAWGDLWRPFADGASLDAKLRPPTFAFVLDLHKIVDHDGDVANLPLAARS